MPLLIYLAIAFFISLCLELFIIPRLLIISYKKKLFDETDERKRHTGFVSRLGGATFIPIILFALCITMTVTLFIDPTMETILVPEIGSRQLFLEFAFLFSGLVLLYLVGVADDLIGVGYKAKFAVQLLCGIFTVTGGVWLNDFNGLLGVFEISPWFGYPFTVFVVVFIINAVNLIDGIDGLASGLCIIAFAVLSISFYVNGYLSFALIAVTTMGCLISFFYYNVFGRGRKLKKRVFMGDTGTLTIGMLLAYLLIRYAMIVSAKTVFPNPLIIFSVIIIPCFDAASVAISRIRRGKNPFKPDRNHLHHKLMRIGIYPRRALIIILTMSLVFIVMNYAFIHFMHMQIKWIILIDVMLCLLMYALLRRRLIIVENQNSATL
jgi:UDP-N-acetylmuramyl pentapeptide phosphotransferase/UDP-N-acetylglucosamine-1-phosphate transferase